jgi:hypothetical protein
MMVHRLADGLFGQPIWDHDGEPYQAVFLDGVVQARPGRRGTSSAKR